jgi:hypothetical protein
MVPTGQRLEAATENVAAHARVGATTVGELAGK